MSASSLATPVSGQFIRPAPRASTVATSGNMTAMSPAPSAAARLVYEDAVLENGDDDIRVDEVFDQA